MSLSFGPASPIQSGASETRTISLTLPPSSITSKVDIALLLDDTGSFSSFSGTVASIFTNLVSSLEANLPGVDFGFGVTRFEDYGGTGTNFSSDVNTSRPFILNQPIVTIATAGSTAARNSLITTALSHTAPGGGGDGPESDLEALYQIATGAGFVGNNDGDTTDSGNAGALSTQTTPGTSGDVPTFSTNTLPASGTLGGVGWRPDALHLVILATDIGTVTAFPAGSAIPSTVTGANGVTVPTSAFNAGGRFGLEGAVAPIGAATLQSTISGLNSLGIRVLGMGPGAGPTTSTSASSSPSTFLSALGRLTGTLDSSGNPLVFSTSVSTSALTTAIANAITTTSTLPVNIGLSTTALPAHLSFSRTPGVVPGVGPGGTATFSVTLTGDGSPVAGSFDINFVDVSSSAILGTIPVSITAPTVVNTTTTLTSNVNPSSPGQAVTFTALVTPNSGGGTPTGSVEFFDGSTSLGSRSLSGGSASIIISSLSVGTHTITAKYGGDPLDNPSTSAPLTQEVVEGSVAEVADVRVLFGTRSYSLIGNTRDLPWTTITAIQVVFTHDVAVDRDDLRLAGLASGILAGSFSYDPATRTATLALAAPLGRDRLSLALDGDGTPADGNDGVRLPGGGSLRGGDYALAFDVLPGDVDGDGVVAMVDSVAARDASLGFGAYALWADLDGDGDVDLDDMNAPRRRLGWRLP